MNVNNNTNPRTRDFAKVSTIAPGGVKALILAAEEKKVNAVKPREQLVSVTAEQALNVSRGAALNAARFSLAENVRIIRDVRGMKLEQAEKILDDVRQQVRAISKMLLEGIEKKSHAEREEVVHLIAKTHELLFASAAKSIELFQINVMDPIADKSIENNRTAAINALELLTRVEHAIDTEQKHTLERLQIERKHDRQRELDDRVNALNMLRDVLKTITEKQSTRIELNLTDAILTLDDMVSEHNRNVDFIRSIYPFEENADQKNAIIAHEPYFVTEEDGTFTVMPGEICLKILE